MKKVIYRGIVGVIISCLLVASAWAGTITKDTTDWNAWDQVAGLPGGNLGYALTAGTYSNYIYAVGGDGSGQTNVVRFNGTTWTNVTGLPGVKTRLAGAVHDGYLYAIAGNSGGSTNVYAFNGTTWTQVRGLPAAREWLGAGVLGTNMYAIGGSTSTNVYRFGGQSVIWAQVRGLPLSRDKLTVATLSNILYVIGGTTSTNVWSFNGTNWTGVAGLPLARQAMAAVAFDGYIYAIGGENGSAMTNVYRYNGTSWSEAPSLPNARNALAAAVLSNKLYAIGGSDQTNVFRYPAGSYGSGISPESGSYTGGYNVAIYGTGLCNGTTDDVTSITLCGIEATIVDIQGSTQLTVRAGAATGAAVGLGDVRVVSTAQGESVKTNGFTYTGAPGLKVLGTNGAAISSGAQVSISAGTLFVPPLVVGSGAITNILSLTNAGASALTISGVTTGGAGAAAFAVDSLPGTIAGGSAASNFAVVFTPTAVGQQVATITIANDSPSPSYTVNLQGLAYTIGPTNSGPLAGGSTITITNGHYGTVTNVLVGGTAATIVSSGDTWVTITLPASGSTGTKDVAIQTSDYGSFTMASSFTYRPAGYINRLVEDWNNWSSAGALPTNNLGVGCLVEVNDRLFLSSGTNMLSFDLTNWTWVAGCPEMLSYPAFGTISNMAYFAGGSSGSAPMATNTYRFNGTNWTMVLGLPTGCAMSASAVMNDELYVVGGTDEGGTTPRTNVFRFNGTTWSECNGLPSANKCMVAAALSNNLYVSGGYPASSAVNTFLSFNGTDWTTRTVLPQVRALHGTVAFNGRIYIIGGFDGSSGYSSVYSFDGSSWTAAPSLPETLTECTAITYHNAIYAADRTGGTGMYRFPALTGSQGVVPSSGVRNGGYQVTIIGTNLGSGADITNVMLCGVSASSIVSQDATQVVIVAGASGSSVTGDVRVFSVTYGESVLTNGFAYLGTGKDQQTITFPAITNQVKTSVVRLAATASSGLPVSFAVASGPATISGGTNLSFSTEGKVSVTASQAGNTQYDPAPDVTRSFFVVGSFSFRAVALTNNVTLRWSSPDTVAFSNQTVMVRFDTNDYPETSADGSSLYTGTNQVYSHESLLSGQSYYYTVFVSQDGTTFTNPP